MQIITTSTTTSIFNYQRQFQEILELVFIFMATLKWSNNLFIILVVWESCQTVVGTVLQRCLGFEGWVTVWPVDGMASPLRVKIVWKQEGNESKNYIFYLSLHIYIYFMWVYMLSKFIYLYIFNLHIYLY